MLKMFIIGPEFVLETIIVNSNNNYPIIPEFLQFDRR